MTDLYIEDITTNWKRNGSYFEDSYMVEDMKVCKNILELQ